MDQEGVHPDPEKIESVRNYSTPTTLTELRRFLGLTSWYRRFIENYSTIAAPLCELLKKNEKFEWSPRQQEAFEKIKTVLTTAPILACPDFTQPFTLATDASEVGIGAILSQNLEGKEKVIAYANRSLTETECKYGVTERECLGVYWAIYKFRPYIEGQKFSVITDHAALKWLHSLKNVTGRLARCALALQQYTFDIIHKKGVEMKPPDALSRHPTNESILVPMPSEIVNMDNNDWYNNMFKKVKENPNTFPVFCIQGNELWRKSDNMGESLLGKAERWRLCVPKAEHFKIMTENHKPPTAGHLGIKRTLNRIRE